MAEAAAEAMAQGAGGDPPAAEQIAQLRASGDKPGLAAALLCAVGASMAEGRSVQALEMAEEALRLLRPLGDTGSRMQLLHTITGLDIAEARPEDALRESAQAATYFRKLGDKEGEAYGQLASAVAHAAKSEAGKASQAAAMALGLFQKAGSKEGECAALQTASSVQLLMGDAKEALKAADKARAIAQGLKDRPEVEAACLLDVANAHMGKATAVRGDPISWRKAAQAAKLALERCRELGDEAGEAAALRICAQAQSGEKEAAELLAGPAAQGRVREGPPAMRAAAYHESGRGPAANTRTRLMYQCRGVSMS